MRPTISTTTGDNGSTSLYGGTRVSKSAPRIHAYGDVDELNAIIGVTLSEEDVPAFLKAQLTEIQRTLFTLGADLATKLDSDIDVTRITERDTELLEQWGARLEKQLPELNHFILPSGCRAGCLLHQARTVCRRTERWVVDLAEKEEINGQARLYINRLSDYLFLAARMINKEVGKEETEWVPS